MAQFFAAAGAVTPSFVGTTLVVPTVTSGHVAQLAVDRLVAANLLERVGALDDPDVLPFAAYDACHADPKTAPPKQLAASVEVYQDCACQLTVLQLRAPLREHSKAAFASRLIAWAKASGMRAMVVLTGADAGQLIDAQLAGGRLFVLSGATAALPALPAVPTLAPVPPSLAPPPASPPRPYDQYQFAGTGFTRQLLHRCDAVSLPVSALVLYIPPGDGFWPSAALAKAACEALGLATGDAAEPARWPLPLAWGRIMDALPVPVALYM